MNKTSAERQAAFRKRMNDRGFRLKQIWVDKEGFPGNGRKGREALQPPMSLDQLVNELVRLTEGIDENFKSRLYGELAAYARGVRELMNLTRLSPELFQIKESEDNKKKFEFELF
ncbi:MAG: hypothetical protein LBT95_10220 [Treponema sp.]|jgi:hypothetical protein|nr:hypothetical protein [Treponema sp.]